ncbi:MAG: ion transporter [gamma proteobacterium symbiont of Phacoides pectinatus]
MALSVRGLVEAKWFQGFIIGVILFNAAVLGMQTYRTLPSAVLENLDLLDRLCLVVFVIEILLKLSVYRLSFFRQGWNLFDFVIVAIALVPATGGLSILRAFRIFRVLRLITAVQSIRRVVSGMLVAIPGVGSVGGLLLIVFYIGAVISTTLYGEAFPEWFGSLGASMYTLFQIMTLESWSMGIVRPVMELFPYSWLFFVPFITVTSFTVLNLFIGIIVDAMATVKEEEFHSQEHEAENRANIRQMKADIEELNRKLSRLLEQRG